MPGGKQRDRGMIMQDLNGLSKEEAISIIRDMNYRVDIEEQDGIKGYIEMHDDTNRVFLTIENGIVINYRIE